MNVFNDAPLMVACCTHVYRGAQVQRVVRTGSDWYFSCGQHGDDPDGELTIVSVQHMLRRDGSLSPLFDLAPSSVALRKDAGERWVRQPVKLDGRGDDPDQTNDLSLR